MIFRDAFRSLKRDFSRALFYWLTFVIVTTFFFLFFNFSSQEASGLDFIDSNYLITGVVVLMMVVCSIDIFFANNFFIKTKSKDLGVRLVCGGTYVHIASYLLIQTAILLFTAIPVAGLLSVGLIPVFNSVLAAMTDGTIHIAFSSGTNMLTGIVIAYLVFWLVMLNLSFAYQNTAGAMMNERNMTKNRGEGSMFKLPSAAVFSKILNTVLFIGPLIGFWFVPPTVYIVLAFVGVYGFNGFVKTVIQPICAKISSGKGLENPEKMIIAGFFNTDLAVNSMNIMLYIISVIVLGALLITAHGQAVETCMVLSAYVTASVLQAMVLMFRSSSEFGARRKYYHSLEQIGFVEDELKKITAKETILFFGFILVTAMLYVGIMMINMVRHDLISAGIAGILVFVQILPMIVFGAATWWYHAACIYPLPKER